jgi:hydroxymethylglutaryl-CoA lyase
MKKTIQLIECPRDAMQGWKTMIPTERKIRYINALMHVGFHTIDVGSFVSPKMIPQMADTSEVLKGLEASTRGTKLLAIIANLRGAQDAVQQERIHYLGFPFSVSETFQVRNTNSTPDRSLELLHEIQQLCALHGKELVVYMSMGFGNPYGDPYSMELLANWIERVQLTGVRIISLADTVGIATPELVGQVVGGVAQRFTNCTLGVHLHCRPDLLAEKLEAALAGGAERLDGAIGGIGGCPMADDELVGNMDTRGVIAYLEAHGYETELDMAAFATAEKIAAETFNY